MRLTNLCCVFSNLHTSGGTDEFEIAEKIKKKCELLSYVMKINVSTLLCIV